MLTLLSPAKKLAEFDRPYSGTTTTPVFPKKTNELITMLKTLPVSRIGSLMHLSSNLAELNYQRFQSFYSGVCPDTAGYPAVLLFQGDVYRSMKADKWDKATLEFSQGHLAILSGLYGILKPLDLIQPYRLEMGTSLENACGKNLYAFWQANIADELNNQLASHSNQILVNLASTEYFSAVDTSRLKFPLVTIHFKEKKGNETKVIGIYAKKARGAMADYLMRHQIENVEAIKKISILNYRFCEQSSDERDFNFVRE